jgi:alpha-galactosidase
MNLRRSAPLALLLGWCASAALAAQGPTLAAAPPMGWNSWDAYGLTINERDFKANAAVLAGIKQLGWTYVVIDEGWYMDNPLAETLAGRDYQVDMHGLLIPAAGRFPSAANGMGFKPLAEWVHAQGLKFGIHIVRGIPKQAVGGNRPVAGSRFHAADVADPTDTCPWDDGNYGVRDTAAGQAYYDSMLKQYADWGLDFIKVDCIADHPYKPAEIRQIHTAIERAGRPIVLSLSPGPTQLAHAQEVSQYAQLWRISNDIWDGWSFTYKNPKEDFPAGVVTGFDNLARWSAHAKPGTWPDADMLPLGSLTPHPGWGAPRASRLTQDEQRTQFLLWSVARSPLILGGNLTRLDDFTRSLISNKAIIALNQTAVVSRPVDHLPAGFASVRVWVAEFAGGSPMGQALALFNLDDKPVTLAVTWQQIGIAGAQHSARNLVDDAQLPSAASLQFALPPHGSVAYGVN